MADDVVQTTFLQLVRTQPQFENDRHAKAWLLRVAINCCKDLHRSAWQSKMGSLDEMQERQAGTREVVTGDNVIASANTGTSSAGDEHHPEHAFAKGEQQKTVRDAVATLPSMQRNCIHLFYFEDLNIAEIALITEQPSATVKSHLHRGRAKLRSILGEEYDYEA